MPRLYCPEALHAHAALKLPPTAARHVQVLRLQPGAELTLFDGRGGEYAATVARMGRSEVEVQVGEHRAVEREAARSVHLAIGMPANERMDWLVEKATELGAASIQPLLAERSVLRLAGERAQKKQAHWQGIAVAACEQCGRNRVPLVHPVLPLQQWLLALPGPGARWALSLRDGARDIGAAIAPQVAVTLLSGPEGGLSPGEETAAIGHGFLAVSLGTRVLRAETAPLAALALLALQP